LLSAVALPQTQLGELIAPDLLAVFKGPTSKGWEEKGKGGEGGGRDLAHPEIWCGTPSDRTTQNLVAMPLL